MYMCVCVWFFCGRMSERYVLCIIRYEKVTKCFTDQNMLNTVNTKSLSLCFISPTAPTTTHRLSHWMMETWGGRGGGAREGVERCAAGAAELRG